MQVLSVDPGYRRLGWAVLSVDYPEVGCPVTLDDWGVFTAQRQAKKTGFNREMNLEGQAIVGFFQDKVREVDSVAWEIPPSFGRMSNRERVVSALSHIKALTWTYYCPYQEFAPRSVKKKFCGTAKAEKKDIRDEVHRRFPDFPVIENIPTDVYDAIAVGVVAIEENQWL